MNMTKTPPKLSDLLNGAQLPALPQSAIRLLELSHDPKNGPAEYAAPIEADPGLTGQVLRFVNSSYFGFAQEISSIRLAISLVGVRTIKNFALWSAVFSLMPNPKCGPFDLKSLWQDSLRRGIFSRVVGRMLKLAEADDLFAASLLQDMAVPLLAKELPDDYKHLLLERAQGSRRLSTLEKERFGWTHAEAGALMARNWRLPAGFAELIATHVSQDSESDNRGPGDHSGNSGAAVIGLSAQLPSSIDAEWVERDAFLAGYQTLCGDRLPVTRVFQRVDEEFVDFSPILKLPSTAKPLVEVLASAQATAQ